MQKTASDAFYETELEDALHASSIDRVLVCGLMTEFCVDATCRAALSRNYEVTLVSDAHTTGDSSQDDAQLKAAQIIDHHNRVLANLAHPARLARLCAEIFSLEQGHGVLKDILRRYGVWVR